jgi:MYXO-CTERM domain-containing protein
MKSLGSRVSSYRSFRLLAGLASVTFACFTLHDARAGWPPSVGADLQDSSNWPNDPDYGGYWNFFSYLPTQSNGTAPYLSADQTLGASGMSIDKAWEYTTGSPEVRIAIMDSGIEWDAPDLVNKAWLNYSELANHLPHHADGTACGPALPSPIANADCDGDGVFTVADYADDPTITPIVNGDPCTVPGSMPPVTNPRIQGDVNHNCILDPGDLIELYSDGVDDDSNGYTDDIAGWDFYKDDNNPYDDVRYGHGTGEAKDSSAEGNNALEGIGVCPQCRFVMLRAGNSFIANSNNFAKGVVYATDNGFNVVQEALGSVNLTAFARAAIDYAYSKKVIVVASMADENSRHHNLPATYNHTLPVHAIDYNGSSDTTSTSFLAFNNCTNYGGQLALSVSGTSCSSEATGKTGGISGLLYSYALQQTPSITLTAEEAMQLQKMTADVVNVPQSRAPATASSFYESLPGFSQRFGYGRTNVPNALAAIKSGLIPPEVEILSPAWFETLYSNRVTGPVPLVGRVVATRATSYDVTVQWAPGVEPLDSEFMTLAATMTNVPGATVMGGASMPLAVIDPSSLNTAHTPDPDSPHHENDRTITVRVQATAHYPTGDVMGEARRSIALVNPMNGLDTDLLPGFPLALGGSVEGGPKLADINGDGVRDIVLTTNDGSVHVFSVKGGAPTEIQGFPYRLRPVDGLDPTSPVPSLPSYVTAPAYLAGKNGGIDPAVTRESVDGSAAIGSLLGTTQVQIVFASWEGTLYVVDSQGGNLTGWPQRLPLVPSCPQDPNVTRPPGDCMDVLHDLTRGSFASPVLVDLDGDGTLEIVLAAFDGNVYVFNADGTMHAGFPVRVHSPLAYKFDHVITTPAVADFNSDGVPDILVGSNETIGNQGNVGFFYVIDGRGTAAPGSPFLKNWPVEVESEYTLPIVGQGTNSSPAIFDIDGDGVPDAFLQGNAQGPLVLPGDPGVQSSSSVPASQLPKRTGGLSNGFDGLSAFGAMSDATLTGDEMLPIFSHPSVGDLDQDGIPDVVMSGSDLFLALNMESNTPRPFQHLLAMWNGKTGHMMPGSPVVMEDYSFLTNQAIADITGDDYPEVIMGTGGYFVHAVDACGREAPSWPKFTGGWMTATPAVGDINGDGTLEVVEATREGFLYAWTTKGTDKGVVQWESFHHDNANTGNYRTPLDQGKLELAAKPLDCSAPNTPDAGTTPDAGGGGDAAVEAGPTSPPAVSPGGCRCTVGSRATEEGSWIGLAVVGLALARRRRRDV